MGQYAPTDLKDNGAIVLAAMQKDAQVLQFASEKLRNNYDLMLKAIEMEPWLLQYASESLKNNKDLTLVAVKKNRLARLFVIHKKFKDDPDVIRAAAG